MVERITEESLREALQDLKVAKSLATSNINNPNANENEMEHSMQLYQSSIDLLIRALNADVSKLDFHLNKDALQPRVKRALSQAETLKLVMPKKKSASSPNSSTTTATISQTKSFPSETSRSVSKRTLRTPTCGNTNLATVVPLKKVQSVPSRHLQNPLYPVLRNSVYMPSSSLPKTPLDSLSGLERPKRTLRESVFLPLQRPGFYTGLRTPPAGVLFYGPPGTGKTLLVKAAAYETRDRTMFFNCSSGTLSSKWHGEGEKILVLLFQIAREAAPSIIFLDEMDALLGKRGGTGGGGGGGGNESETGRRFKTEFMVQMDGMTSSSEEEDDERTCKRVWVMGCTNTPWDLDDAILRRFTARIYVPLPDGPTRRKLLGSLLERNANSVSDRQLSDLVDATEGYSCSDLIAVGREAAFGPLRDLEATSSSSSSRSGGDATHLDEAQLRPISHADFRKSVGQTTKSVSAGLLKRFKDWEKEQGCS